MSTNVSTVFTYQLNGASQDFKIPFDYLSRRFVKVTLLGKDRKVLTFMTDYRFMSPTVIRTNKVWGPSDGYNYIEIRRETSARDLIVDFSDGSILRANDLNTANLQAMHIAEEARSLAADSLSVNDEGDLDARFRKIVNLGDPVGRKDAVTKAYVDDAKDSVTASRNKALQYRNEAQAFRNQTEGLKNDTNTIKSQAVSETNRIKEEARGFAVSSNGFANESKAQISKAKAVLSDVQAEGVIANGYAVATIEHAKASAENAKVAQLNATASQENKVACAGYEAATAVYEQRAREVESTVVAAKNTAEQKAKEANVSASKSNESKLLAEKAKVAAQESASQTSQYKDSAAASAAAAARDAASATQSANNAIAQASAAQSSATKAKASEDAAKKYSETINPNNLMPKTGGKFTGNVTIEGSFPLSLTSSHNNGDALSIVANSPSASRVTVVHNKQLAFWNNPRNLLVSLPEKQGTLAIADDYVPKNGGGTFTGKIYINNTAVDSAMELSSNHGAGDVLGLTASPTASNGPTIVNRSSKPIRIYQTGTGNIHFPGDEGVLALTKNIALPYRGSAPTGNINTTYKNYKAGVYAQNSQIGYGYDYGTMLVTSSQRADTSPTSGAWYNFMVFSTNGTVWLSQSINGSAPTRWKQFAFVGQYKLDDHYKRTRSSIAKSKLSEREMRKEIEDLKYQIQELREMLLNVAN